MLLKEKDKMEKLEHDCKQLVRQFYFDSTATQLEKIIENDYLIKKEIKFIYFINLKHSQFGTQWTFVNAKRKDMQMNYKLKKLDFFDEEFLPIFDPISSKSELLEYEDLKKGKDLNYFKQIFKYFFDKDKEKLTEDSYLNKYDENLAESIFFRIEKMIDSIEYKNIFNMSTDFYFEHLFIDIHIYLISKRLMLSSSVRYL